jgi:hypothetical protein
VRKYSQRVTLLACFLLVSKERNNFKKITENSTTSNVPFYILQKKNTVIFRCILAIDLESIIISISQEVEPWLRRLVTNFSPQKLWFSPKDYVFSKVAPRQISADYFRYHSTSDPYSFTYHRRHISTLQRRYISLLQRDLVNTEI